MVPIHQGKKNCFKYNIIQVGFEPTTFAILEPDVLPLDHQLQ